MNTKKLLSFCAIFTLALIAPSVICMQTIEISEVEKTEIKRKLERNLKKKYINHLKRIDIEMEHQKKPKCISGPGTKLITSTTFYQKPGYVYKDIAEKIFNENEGKQFVNVVYQEFIKKNSQKKRSIQSKKRLNHSHSWWRRITSIFNKIFSCSTKTKKTTNHQYISPLDKSNFPSKAKPPSFLTKIFNNFLSIFR